MKKKLTVITGGTSGMGLASAKCLAHETSILICARGAAGLEKARQELLGYGADVYTFQMDAADESSVQKCAEYAATLGEVVNVIHTAGVSPANTAADDILRINTLGPIHMVNAFYPVLAEGGVMICFGSTSGYSFETNSKQASYLPEIGELFAHWQEPDFCQQMKRFLLENMELPQTHLASVAYALTKKFVRYFVQANVVRFARKNCRIISVSPGSYLTPMHQALIDNRPETAERVRKGIPLQRWGHAYEIGKLVEFLCSGGAGYITGVDILADGGFTYCSVIPQIE